MAEFSWRSRRKEGDEIPDEPEELKQIGTRIETKVKGRKGIGKKKNKPKAVKPRKAAPKKRKEQSKSIAPQGRDQGRRGRIKTKANGKSSPKRNRPRSESSSHSAGGRRQKGRKSSRRSLNVSNQSESKRRTGC